MTRLDKSLSKVFGVPELGASEIQGPSMEKEFPAPAVVESTSVMSKEQQYPVTVPDSQSAQIDEDTEFVKHKLKSLLANGENAFATLAEIAKAEERASHFEALTGMMNGLSSIAMGILDAEGKRQKLKAGLGEEGQPAQTVHNTQNNTTVYVGTTADLQRMLDEEDVIDVEAKPQQDEDSQ
jgi:hypothetical protein